MTSGFPNHIQVLPNEKLSAHIKEARKRAGEFGKAELMLVCNALDELRDNRPEEAIKLLELALAKAPAPPVKRDERQEELF